MRGASRLLILVVRNIGVQCTDLGFGLRRLRVLHGWRCVLTILAMLLAQEGFVSFDWSARATGEMIEVGARAPSHEWRAYCRHQRVPPLLALVLGSGTDRLAESSVHSSDSRGLLLSYLRHEPLQLARSLIWLIYVLLDLLLEVVLELLDLALPPADLHHIYWATLHVVYLVLDLLHFLQLFQSGEDAVVLLWLEEVGYLCGAVHRSPKSSPAISLKAVLAAVIARSGAVEDLEIAYGDVKLVNVGLCSVYRLTEAIKALVAAVGLVTKVAEEILTQRQNAYMRPSSRIELERLPKENGVLADGITLLQRVQQELVAVGVQDLDVDEAVDDEHDGAAGVAHLYDLRAWLIDGLLEVELYLPVEPVDASSIDALAAVDLEVVHLLQ